MVKGGYYKLLAKNTNPEQPNQLTAGSPARCPRLTRFKVHILVFSLVLLLLVTGLNYVYPISRSVSKPLNNLAAPVSRWSNESNDGKDRIRYKHTRRKLPSCIIIGMRKAGTRALLTFLNLHPQIITAKQEVHFFDDNYDRGLDWYRREMPFSFPEQVTIEKTPAYFITNEAPERIREMNSSVLLLLIIRDPVERAISDYNQILLKKQTRNKPMASFEDLAIGSHGEVNLSFNALRRSLYSVYMKKWLDYFPLKQFHIVNGEGLVDDPLPHIYAIEEFLGLEHRITKENFYFNETRGFYCIRNETMEKCLNPSKGREHPPVRKDVIDKLRAFYRPYNEQFYHLVHKDFGWL